MRVKCRSLFGFLIVVGYLTSSSQLVFPQVPSRALLGMRNSQGSGNVLEFELRTFILASKQSDQSRLIVQLGFSNSELQYIKHEKQIFKADIDAIIILSDTLGTEIERDEWDETFFAEGFDLTVSPAVYNTTRESYDIDPGYYDLSLSVTDKETGRKGERQKRIHVRKFAGDSVALSDVLFLNSVAFITPDTVHNIPKKLPNSFFAYYEVYNVPEGDSILLDFVLSDLKKEVAGSRTLVSKGSVTEDYIEISKDSLNQLLLQVELKVRHGEQIFEMVQALNPNAKKLNPAYENLDKAIEVLTYVMKRKELKKLKALEGEDKIAAFNAFWKKKDPTPATPENEYMIQYYRRIAFANKEFSGVDEGWKTEMGMVLVKLGRPDYIDNAAGVQTYDSFSKRPVVVWQYLKYGRRVVFGYRGGRYRIANYNQIFDLLSGDDIRL